MHYQLYRTLRRLATRCPWWLARRLYRLAFRCLDRHNAALDARA